VQSTAGARRAGPRTAYAVRARFPARANGAIQEGTADLLSPLAADDGRPPATEMTDADLPRLRYRDGDLIFSQDSPGDRAFVIVSGKVRIWRNAGARFVDLCTLGPGGIFGELSLFDGRPRVASATAIEDTVCIPVTPERFRAMLDAAEPFTRQIVEQLVEYARTWLAVMDTELGDDGMEPEDVQACREFLAMVAAEAR
jgi:CRP-like cAMP-binding protein